MIHVAGGVYRESCLEPRNEDLFGSGGRAAAALAQLSEQVHLHTYVSQRQRPTLDALAETFGFQLHAQEVMRTPLFRYQHGLAEPHIYPPIGLIQAEEALRIDEQCILRFGFLEGDAVVTGDRVVYDPQSSLDPRPFGENGSEANELAVLVNGHEGFLLTGKRTVCEIGKVLKDAGADVVVVKQGSRGASLFTLGGERHLPAYRTDKVWAIGSGDVFAATFAHFWAERKASPEEAADNASLASAYYCSTQVLPIPTELYAEDSFQPSRLSLRDPRSSEPAPLVYLAGPFFTMAERWMVENARSALLNQGLQVFSPLHDVGHGVASDVVPEDIDAIERSDVVFALVDNLDPGTLFEIGYARAMDIPVVAFVQKEGEEAIKMLEGSDCELNRDFVSAVYMTAWKALGV